MSIIANGTGTGACFVIFEMAGIDNQYAEPKQLRLRR